MTGGFSRLICRYHVLLLGLKCLLVFPGTVGGGGADTNQKLFIRISQLRSFCWRPQTRHRSALLKGGAAAKVAEDVFWSSLSMTSSGTGLSIARRRESN